MRLQGSNQFKSKYPWHKVHPLVYIGILALLAQFIIFREMEVNWERNIISPLGSPVFASEVTPTPRPEPTWQNINAEIVKVFGSEGKGVTKQALDIAFCESGWRSDAYNFNTNNTGDYNVFQINDVHVKKYGEGFKHDWIENIRVAKEIYLSHGKTFNAWVCAKKLAISK